MKTTDNLNYTQFKILLGDAKKNSDPICCKLIFRPLSFPVGWLIYKTGLTANMISLISILFTVLSSLILIFCSEEYIFLVSFLLLFIALLDCIDGNVARARGTAGPGGEWMDALSGYTVYALIPLALGIHIYFYHQLFFLTELWIIIGALTSISNLFLRLLYQKFINSNSSNFDQKYLKVKNSFFSKISGEVGLVGWMMPAFFLASITNMFEVYLAFYCFFYLTSAVVVSVILGHKIISL